VRQLRRNKGHSRKDRGQSGKNGSSNGFQSGKDEDLSLKDKGLATRDMGKIKPTKKRWRPQPPQFTVNWRRPSKLSRRHPGLSTNGHRASARNST
jgi:hypothetical protein